ncbi:MAG: hypothetical protein HS126_10990 [Anaerolineales bacterium]|nr:hypothetical protein [Anaerolineales bacterium]
MQRLPNLPLQRTASSDGTAQVTVGGGVADPAAASRQIVSWLIPYSDCIDEMAVFLKEMYGVTPHLPWGS